MADKVVQVPGLGNVAFPDTMSDDDISSVITQQVQQASAPNAGLAPPAGPNIDMQTSGLGTAYGYLKGFGGETARATFSAGGPEQAQLPPATDEQLNQRQSLGSYFSQSSPRNVLPNIGTGISDTGKAIAQGASTPEGAGALTADAAMLLSGGRQLLPSKTKAGALFNEASQAAGKSVVDVTGASGPALKIWDLAQAGGRKPKVISDFLRRTTTPGAAPLTYDEARMFYQQAGELAFNEKSALTPTVLSQLKQFRYQLGQAIGQTAEDAGVGQQYSGAMSQYAQASKMDSFLAMLKNGTVAAAKKAGEGAMFGTGAAGPGYMLYRYLTGDKK